MLWVWVAALLVLAFTIGYKLAEYNCRRALNDIMERMTTEELSAFSEATLRTVDDYRRKKKGGA